MHLAPASELGDSLPVGWGWSSPITAERLIAPTGRTCAGGGFFVPVGRKSVRREGIFVAKGIGMNGLIIEIRSLWRSFWKDPLFAKLLGTVVAGAGALMVGGVDWEVVCAFVGLGCLTAMLEVTLRD